ncbi:hypothetical protein ACP3W2_27210, partial [Salmonella enterica]|uniref:hypothetical protein n=1 Tax=Salmonella enterica TaxID=28901 RepID=UPI003CFB5142
YNVNVYSAHWVVMSLHFPAGLFFTEVLHTRTVCCFFCGTTQGTLTINAAQLGVITHRTGDGMVQFYELDSRLMSYII